MAEVPGIAQYQLSQLSPREYHFIYALLAGANAPAVRDAVRKAIAGIYGRDAELRIALVNGIPPDQPGKYRMTRRYKPVPVVSLLDPKFAPAGMG
jgi:hypothetical protein